MPSRWSISCWITRASSPSASISSGSPRCVARAHAHARGALDLDVHAGQAQAALLGGLQLLAQPLDLGVDERRRADHRRRLCRRARDAARRAAWRRARLRARRASARPCAATSACSAPSKRSTGSAVARSTGSPNLRTRRSAASRRARVSASSSAGSGASCSRSTSTSASSEVGVGNSSDSSSSAVRSSAFMISLSLRAARREARIGRDPRPWSSHTGSSEACGLWEALSRCGAAPWKRAGSRSCVWCGWRPAGRGRAASRGRAWCARVSGAHEPCSRGAT